MIGYYIVYFNIKKTFNASLISSLVYAFDIIVELNKNQ